MPANRGGPCACPLGQCSGGSLRPRRDGSVRDPGCGLRPYPGYVEPRRPGKPRSPGKRSAPGARLAGQSWRSLCVPPVAMFWHVPAPASRRIRVRPGCGLRPYPGYVEPRRPGKPRSPGKRSAPGARLAGQSWRSLCVPPVAMFWHVPAPASRRIRVRPGCGLRPYPGYVEPRRPGKPRSPGKRSAPGARLAGQSWRSLCVPPVAMFWHVPAPASRRIRVRPRMRPSALSGLRGVASPPVSRVARVSEAHPGPACRPIVAVPVCAP